MLQPTETERRDIVKAIFGESLADHSNSSRFKAYFEHYCSVVCPAVSGDAVIELDTPALTSHADVLSCVQTIVEDPSISFNRFVAKTVGPKSPQASWRENEHVARVAVEVAFAINCTLKNYYPDSFADSDYRHIIKWEGDVPFLCFIENAFNMEPLDRPRSLEQQQRQAEMTRRKGSIKAWKLTKRYGIKIRGTNNLLEHLMLDRKTMTLKVFNQVSFLRAHLAKTKQDQLDLGFEASLKRGTLPPRLLIETLLTVHDVLFPVASVRDKKSRVALKTMIKKHGFDPEWRWIEFVRAIPPDMAFDYWGDRLSILHVLVHQPPPTNAIVSWFERHTSDRNALTVAIIGLFLSALFGMLSFIVGLLQLILAWVAYRHPPAPSG